MTDYPFSRGLHPVGVRTIEFVDSSLSPRPIQTEIWYPATDAHRGQDLDPATFDRYLLGPGMPEMMQQAVRDAVPLFGPFPLFMYFHGGYGQRRECSHLTTHLASHGFFVASANFPGDNMTDLIPGEGGEATVAKTPIDESARLRPVQASRFIDLVLDAAGSLGLQLDASRIGAGGISMGGYTTLAVNSIDGRLGAVFPMCPMYGEHSMAPQVGRLAKLLRVDNWKRRVPTLLLTGAVDPLVNAEDIRSLYDQVAPPKRLVVLHKAGHMHFGDNAEAGHEWYRNGYLSGSWPDPELDAIALGTAMRPFAELCTEEQSCGTARALCLAHMDAHLNGNAEARAFLESDLARTLETALGVEVDVVAAHTRERLAVVQGT
jgi:dienelactone hydrolase